MENWGNKDRISDLPDDILLVILSKTDIRTSALSTILSKRRSHLFHYIPELEFCKTFFGISRNEHMDPDKWITIINHIFKSRCFPIKSCRIFTGFFEMYEDEFEDIICFLCEGGVVMLMLIHEGEDEWLKMSQQIFLCNTIEKLDLERVTLQVPPIFNGLQKL